MEEEKVEEEYEEELKVDEVEEEKTGEETVDLSPVLTSIASPPTPPCGVDARGERGFSDYEDG